ncbi:MAG: hypothetical protein J2P17_01570, partial [Mycobacterium sp.]|nr:hypothetical protein [Mycobacterium sp.]
MVVHEHVAIPVDGEVIDGEASSTSRRSNVSGPTTAADQIAIHETIALHGHLADDGEWDRLCE